MGRLERSTAGRPRMRSLSYAPRRIERRWRPPPRLFAQLTRDRITAKLSLSHAPARPALAEGTASRAGGDGAHVPQLLGRFCRECSKSGAPGPGPGRDLCRQPAQTTRSSSPLHPPVDELRRQTFPAGVERVDCHRTPPPAATLLENSGNFSYRITSRPLVRRTPAPRREGRSAKRHSAPAQRLRNGFTGH
jgi:hypothetical protein